MLRTGAQPNVGPRTRRSHAGPAPIPRGAERAGQRLAPEPALPRLVCRQAGRQYLRAPTPVLGGPVANAVCAGGPADGRPISLEHDLRLEISRPKGDAVRPGRAPYESARWATMGRPVSRPARRPSAPM